jgi:hypothetical protein
MTVFFIHTGSAAIYKHVDEDGNVVFTDNPHGKKAETLHLSPTNIQPATQPKTKAADNSAGTTTEEEEKAEERVPYSLISISSPDDESTVTYGQETITASVQITPALQADDLIQFYFDGSKQGSASTNSSITFSDLERGEHTISAAVLNAEGKIERQSKSVRIFVMRHSIAH